MRARAATPPTTPPTIAPMFVELLLLLDVSGELIPVPVGLDDVVVSDFDEVVEEVVDRVSESSASRGRSSMEMIVGSGKQRYMDFAGLPAQRNVPHAPQEDSVLDRLHLVRPHVLPSLRGTTLRKQSCYLPATSRAPNARTCALFECLIVETDGVEWRRGPRSAAHHILLIRCASVADVACKSIGCGIPA